MRPIDAEKLKAHYSWWNEERREVFDAIVDMQPTIDAAPVRHGKWIEEDGYQICSNCGEEHAWDEYRANYCDVCGAKMDGERRADND